MNEKPIMLTRKCKYTNRLCAFLYLLISAAIILMGSVIPMELLANNKTPFSFSEIPVSNPNIIAHRTNINVVEGNAVTVNAGPDQNLLAGASQASLAGTMAGASSGINDTTNLVVIFGESNASGMAPISDATALEQGPRINTKILNNNSLVFETMQLGVNNNIQQNVGTGTHGFENGLANAVDAGQLTQPTYLVKLGSAGALISQWLNGGTPQNSQMGWGVLLTRMNAAINYLNSHNIPYKITVWESIGLNDYNAGTSNATFTSQMVQ